jgi:hypothetical protein
VSYGSRPHRPAKEGFGIGTSLVALHGSWAVRIKKGLVTIGMQRGSLVTEVHPNITEAPARRADRRRYHDLQNMQTGGNNADRSRA